MEDNDSVLAFDHFYTTNHIQILKSLLPFLEGEQSGMLPAMIKYMELNYTLSLIKKGSRPMSGGGISACCNPAEGKAPDDATDRIERIYNAVRRYLAPDEEKMFSQLRSTMRTMKNMREMQQMMETLQSMSQDADGGAGGSAFGGLGGFPMPDGLDLGELMQMLRESEP